jgi:hypothetical protein
MAGIGVPPLAGAIADAHGLTAGLALYVAVPIVMVALLVIAGTGLTTETRRTRRGHEDGGNGEEGVRTEQGRTER